MENRVCRRYILRNFGRSIRRYIGYSLALSIGLYAFLAICVEIWAKSGYTWCMLDCIQRLGNVDVFGIWYLPITLVLAERGKTGEKSVIQIVRYENMDQVWIAFWKKSFWTSLWCAVLYSGICMSLSGLASEQLSNWYMYHSLFYQENELLFEGNGWQVLIYFFMRNFIKTFVILISILLVENNDKKRVVVLTIFYACVIGEWQFPKLRIYFNLFSVSYYNFRKESTICIILLLGILLLGFLYTIGKTFWRKKEFYE